ncbi:MAG: hypothetical protein V1926_05490 [Candidatus Peregrinibacteria bacterium]
MKTLTIRTFLLAGMLLLLTSCSPSSPRSADTSQMNSAPGAGGTAVTNGKDIGKMTDDVYVELTAQEIYHNGVDPEVWGALGGGRDRLFARYGVTVEQASAFAEGIGGNGGYERAQQLMDRVDRRLKELQAGE